MGKNRMHQNPIDQLSRALKMRPRHRQAIARELRAHLDEVQRELELSGWEPEAAARESLARFGDPDEIADGFRRVYRPSRRRFGLAFALAGILLGGVYGASGTRASATAAHRSPSPHNLAHALHRQHRP